MHKPQPLRSYLSISNMTISLLYLKTNQQLDLLRLIKTDLPNDLASHLLHCVPKDNHLLIYTDSANWASQLRFHRTTILSVCNSLTNLSITECKVKVFVNPIDSTTKPQATANIPCQAVIDEISNCSHLITDQKLKNSLAKLNQTLSRLKSKGK